MSLVKKISILVLVLVILAIGTFLFFSSSSPIFATDHDISPLHTAGNQILNSKDEPVTLRGVTSEYFRYRMNENYSKTQGGLKEELKKIEKLQAADKQINLVGLYLAGLDKIKENLSDLDAYINFARDHQIYVYLAPTGNAFLETSFDKDKANWYFEVSKLNDLRELTELLASRYGKYPNVIFQLEAEPNIETDKWKVIQSELAALVMKYSDNPIIVTTYNYATYDKLPVLKDPNIIYSTGGYVRRNDTSHQERTVDDILGEQNLRAHYPVIMTEFGGNYGNNFATNGDLDLLKELLLKANAEGMSYTVYRLGSETDEDGLALFDRQGNFKPKAILFLSTLKH